MTQFVDYPWMVFSALVLALLAGALVLAGHARRRLRLARFGSLEAIARLAPADAAAAPRARAWRLALATLCLAVAIAGPRWGSSAQTLDVEGVDVALALDLSLSMMAEDERPSRLERMKQEVRRLRASSPGDRFALLGFAGRSYILSPLTSDDGAIDLFLDNLSPSIVGQAGSAMAPPLRQGIDLLLSSRGDADRALVVMSDGEAFDDHQEALALAAEAKDAGLHLITVGFGTTAGGTIPVNGPNGRGQKRDEMGEIVLTRYDPALLEALATAAGGEFIAAEATDKGNRIRRALAGLETASREDALRLSRPTRYQWFALAALLILLLDAWIADGGRWPRWLRWRVSRAGVSRVLGLTLLATADAQAQGSLDDALRAQRAGRMAEAIRQYRRIIADGDRRPVVMYNLGTALLAADSLNGAVEALERALFTRDEELRTRARYNLGLAYLKRGLRVDGDARRAALQSARRAFRTTLLERPGDPDAQWNYELALRAPDGGGGGSSSSQQDESPAPSRSQQGAMSRQQAEALLDAAARDERDTQARRQRGNTPLRSAGQKDW